MDGGGDHSARCNHHYHHSNPHSNPSSAPSWLSADPCLYDNDDD